MDGPAADAETIETPIVCLGEAIVDLVCEREVDDVVEANAFVPHFGGALANVAVAASRAGAAAALAGGAGDDQWGGWLRARLVAEGVDLEWFALIAGVQTPVAFVTVDRQREPSFQIYGDGITAGIHSLTGRVDETVNAASALVFGSNTLVGEPERRVTLAARERALARGIPVLFDPNIRPNRWDDLGRVVELCRELAAEATIMRANREEAALITGRRADDDPAKLGEGLAALGADVAVVTLGRQGALVRGAATGQVPAVEVEVVSPMGAGDAFMGAFAAAMAARGWEPGQAVEALPAAVAAGAQACSTWGAIE